ESWTMTPAIVETTKTRTYPAVGVNAEKVASKRYSLKDNQGVPTEDWPAIVNRVVAHVSAAETDSSRREDFYQAMSTIMLAREFLPNTPCLVNAGRQNGQLAACFVLDVPDSLVGIMDHAKTTALIHQTGGGTGMTYEHVRPLGSIVSSRHGTASGPVSFMTFFISFTPRTTRPRWSTSTSRSTSPTTFLRPSTMANGFNFRLTASPGTSPSSIQLPMRSTPSITKRRTTTRPRPTNRT